MTIALLSQIIIWLVLIGLVWWIFSTYVLPRIPEPFRSITIVVIALFACLWILNLGGLFPYMGVPVWSRGR